MKTSKAKAAMSMKLPRWALRIMLILNFLLALIGLVAIAWLALAYLIKT